MVCNIRNMRNIGNMNHLDKSLVVTNVSTEVNFLKNKGFSQCNVFYRYNY